MVNCPICNSQNLKIVVNFKNRPYSIFWRDEKLPTFNLKVAKCSECDFLFQYSAYNKKYDKIMNRVYNDYFLVGDSIKEFPINKETFSVQFDFLEKNLNFKEIENVLEIGSSRGDFLYNLKSLYPHLNILGLEPSKLNFVGVPTINAFFKKELFSNKFDLIILRHVFEHIKNPKEFLNEVKSILSENGKIFIEVPNTLRDLKDRVEIFSPDHVNYFTPKSLNTLIESLNLNSNSILNDNKNHLHTLISKESKATKIEYEEIDENLSKYKRSIKDSIKLIKESHQRGYKVVFYGSSNLFISAYSLLNEKLKLNDIIVIDDNRTRIGKRVFDLEIVDKKELKKDDKYLFIICSANRDLIEILKNNVKESFTTYITILPWRGKIDNKL